MLRRIPSDPPPLSLSRPQSRAFFSISKVNDDRSITRSIDGGGWMSHNELMDIKGFYWQYYLEYYIDCLRPVFVCKQEIERDVCIQYPPLFAKSDIFFYSWEIILTEEFSWKSSGIYINVHKYLNSTILRMYINQVGRSSVVKDLQDWFRA